MSAVPFRSHNHAVAFVEASVKQRFPAPPVSWKNPLVALIEKDETGCGFIVTVALPFTMQPFASVMVTLTVVVDEGMNVVF